MEDFIADEEDKELARVAFRRAQRSFLIQFIILMVIVLPILLLSGIILCSPVSENELIFLLFLSLVILFLVLVTIFAYPRGLKRNYERQLDELKLQMRKK